MFEGVKVPYSQLGPYSSCDFSYVLFTESPLPIQWYNSCIATIFNSVDSIH